MTELLDGYAGSSHVMKVRNNDLISTGVLHRIGKNFIDVGSLRNELPTIPCNLLVEIGVYNIQPGFKAPVGRMYLSPPRLACIVDLNETTDDERREYPRISTRDEAVICNCMCRDELMNPGEESGHDSTGDSVDYSGLRVQLVDISLGGSVLKTDEIFKIDDRLNAVTLVMGGSILFVCGVRGQVNRPEGDCDYRCGFAEMATRQEDLLYRYVLGRQKGQLRRIW